MQLNNNPTSCLDTQSTANVKHTTKDKYEPPVLSQGMSVNSLTLGGGNVILESNDGAYS